MRGRSGPRQLKDDAVAELRLGSSGELIWTSLNGIHHEQTFRGDVFCASDIISNSVRVNVEGGGGASFALYNPFDSTRLLALIRWDLVVRTPPTTPVVGAYGIYVTETASAAPTGSTPIVITSCFTTDETVPDYGTNPSGTPFSGVVLPVAKVFVSATLADTPSLFRPFANKLTGGTGKLFGAEAFGIDFQGTALLLPGSVACLQQIGADATNAAAWNTVVWEEILL